MYYGNGEALCRRQQVTTIVSISLWVCFRSRNGNGSLPDVTTALNGASELMHIYQYEKAKIKSTLVLYSKCIKSSLTKHKFIGIPDD